MRLVAFLALVGAVSASCEDKTFTDGGAAWYDDGGDEFTCEYYGEKSNRCAKDGGKFRNEFTANEACCTCGGGNTGECEVDDDWEHPDYFDNCNDYISGDSQIYACDPLAIANCCTCSEDPVTPVTGPAADCQVDNDWEHPDYFDNCNAYINGDSQIYACDPLAIENCCTCGPITTDATCEDITLSNGNKWHDDGGDDYDCNYYSEKASRCTSYGDLYDFGGHNANSACCSCGGGKIVDPTISPPTTNVCADKLLPDGNKWHDDGGESYDCEYYSKKTDTRCGPGNAGSKYTFGGLVANQACCVCGGGDPVCEDPDDPACAEEVESVPDPNANIPEFESEWMGGTKFFNKKLLGGDMALYWNLDNGAKTATIGLLGPEGYDSENRWIAGGLSPSGGMAGSEVFLAYFDENDEPVFRDLWLRGQTTQSIINSNPAGILSNGLGEPTLSRWNGRLQLVYTREWAPSGASVEMSPNTAFSQFIHSRGQMNFEGKCGPLGVCNHIQDDRYSFSLAWKAPPSMSLYDLNKSGEDQPCQGPAKVACQEGWTCFHEFNGDQFAEDFNTYGYCMDPDRESPTADSWNFVNRVFPNNKGGFKNSTQLAGGFELLWTVNRESEEFLSPQDNASFALVSTAPSRQGWIGFGFSPNGFMAGTDVVIGWSESGNEFIGDYFLEDQISSENVIANKQGIYNERVIKRDGQTALLFDRPLVPADSVQLFAGETHVIYASGPAPDSGGDAASQYIPYHRFRQYEDVEIIALPEDEREALGVPAMGICGGPANIKCRTELTCFPIPEEFFEMDFDAIFDAAAEDTSGFTANSEWGHGGRTDNPFGDMADLVGKGFCVSEGMMAQSADFDFSKLGQTQAIDTTTFANKKTLRFGFDIYWNYIDDDTIQIALVSGIGPGWLGLGFGTAGQMIGATSILGWEGFEEGNAKTDEFYHANKLPWEVKPISETGDVDNSMEPTDMEMNTLAHENAIVFTRPIAPTNGFPAIVPGSESTIIYAVGNTPNPVDRYFGYHRFRDFARVDFAK